MGKQERKSARISHEEFCPKEMEAIVEKLGKLREVQREEYISELIDRSDRQKLASSSLIYLRNLIRHHSKVDDRAKNYYLNVIEELSFQLHKTLSPMEIRYIFTEIAELRNNLKSKRRYLVSRFWAAVSERRESTIGVLRTLFSRKKSK